MRYFLTFMLLCLCMMSYGQYNMSNMSVTDCEGTLKDSESNVVSPTYYTNGENYSF